MNLTTKVAFSRLSLGFAVVAALIMCVPAHATLTFNATFDSSITSSPNAAQIEGAINTAINFFESTYTNNITVSIEFESMSSGLGESQVGFIYIPPYQTYYNALVSTDANPAAITGLTSNGGDSADNPVSGTAFIDVKSADLRAVGLAGPPLCNVTGTAGNLTCSGTPGGAGAIDGIVGLNTSITFPPNAQSGNYDLVATAEHEIDEVLGLGSSDANCKDAANGGSCTGAAASTPSPEDLFSYTAPGVFSSLTKNCSDLTQAYLSYSGATVITNLNTACNGGDWGDWEGNTGAQVQNAFATPGVFVPYGASELDAMSAIGYDLAAPEPGTFALVGTALLGAGFLRRRIQARKNG